MMSALMHFYIEVEQTGASSQFYDKFCECGMTAREGRTLTVPQLHGSAV
jgi:hypothetical protein